MLVGDAVLANDDLCVDAGVVDVAKNFGDTPAGASSRCWPARQLDAHHFSWRGAAFLTSGYDNVHENAPIEWNDVAHPVFVAVVPTDDPGVAPLEDADDTAFDAPARLDAFDSGNHTVGVHRFVEVLAGDVGVAAAVERTLGNDEPVAGGVGLEAADVQIHFFGQSVSLPTNVDEIARSDEGVQVPFEGRTIVAGDSE